ncbi:hypothetical protein AX15_000121 [Amanita polypyramis BW_CC]|nr:hypothetical protein AX15_000121 [Amanita polypyramis BW_CC]
MPPGHVLRLPQVDLQALVAQQNPHIDLRLEVYDKSTRNFIKAVSNYKSRAVVVISDRRAQQVAERKKTLEKCQAAEAETNQCKLRELELVTELEREKEERKDVELAVAGFKRQLASLRDRCSDINAEIEQYRATVASLQREKDKERATLSTFATRAAVDFAVCEKYLNCVFEGIEKDQILLRFYCLNPADPEQECSLVLDVSSALYRVMTSSPNPPSMPILVDALNKTRDVFLFMIEVRAAFKNLFHVHT